MKKIFPILIAAVMAAGCKCGGGETAPAEATNGQEQITLQKDSLRQTETILPGVWDIETSKGRIRIMLYEDTPKHKANFEKLAKQGYYDSLLFHRVINGFMIQGGDPYSRDSLHLELIGQGGPGYTIPAEIRSKDGTPLHWHKRGALAAARRGDMANPFKESSGSQFYIVQDGAACSHLDGEYTVFGETVEGLWVIDKIASAQTDASDKPLENIYILGIKPVKIRGMNP